MVISLDKIKKSLKWIISSRLGIIICAAVLLELIGIVQYYSMRNVQREGVVRRVKTELALKSQMIAHTLDKAEATMQEHLWDIHGHLNNADEMFDVTKRLIATNNQIVGGCIAFVPYYYPEKGQYFEPYAYKNDGQISVIQLGSAEHDYTKHPAYNIALNEKRAFWSDPYEYMEDSLSRLTTYTYPLTDEKGKVVALCGLDIDLSWLSDTLNARHVFPSSFGLMFNEKGQMVVEPHKKRDGENDVSEIISLIQKSLSLKAFEASERSRLIDFTDDNNNRKACIFFTMLRKEPHWILATVNYYDEVYQPVKQLRLQNMILMLIGLLVLFFIINRFVRNERKLEEAGIKQARISSELQIANGIQQAMLPKEFPAYPERKDVDIYGSLVPAKEVGGDLFDFFIRDEKLFFCIGDVSGKGVPSAIVMAMVQKLFRVTTAHETNPANILEELNKELSRDNTTNMFITFFLGILDLPTGRLRYCNAGHDNPIIVECGKEDGVQILPVKAHLPLGVISDYKYLSEEYVLPDEAILFLYTDGLTEAKDTQRQQFKLQRVTDTLTHCTQRSAVSAQELLTMMTEEVNHFVGDAEQSDDLSMLAIGYQRPVIKEKVNQSITLQNDVNQITQLNTFVKQFLAQAGLDRKETLRLQLALEEVVVNVMNYAYPPESHGDIIVEAALNENRIKFTISDSGAAFDPTTAARNVDTTLSAEERPIGGLGILLTRKLVDSINYERINGRNILTLRKMMQHE